jgi:hypothetical protein
MHISGAVWDQPPGGWELESAQFVAARAGLQLARLKALRANKVELDHAEHRYRNAMRLLHRIRAGLNDSSTSE